MKPLAAAGLSLASLFIVFLMVKEIVRGDWSGVLVMALQLLAYSGIYAAVFRNTKAKLRGHKPSEITTRAEGVLPDDETKQRLALPAPGGAPIDAVVAGGAAGRAVFSRRPCLAFAAALRTHNYRVGPVCFATSGAVSSSSSPKVASG